MRNQTYRLVLNLPATENEVKRSGRIDLAKIFCVLRRRDYETAPEQAEENKKKKT